MTSDTRKYEIMTGLTILAMTLGLFLGGELSLRAIQWMKFGQQDSVEKSSAYFVDAETGLRLNLPNRRLGGTRINNLGFRGPDIDINKPAGTFRLAFLGSSTTYDGYSPEGKNWPHLVANTLQQRLIGCSVDFVNGGKAGYGTGAMTKLYQHFIIDTDPDLVLIMTGDVSSGLDWLAGQQGIDTDHASYKSAVSEYSVLLQKLEKNFQIIKLQRNADSRTGKLKVDVEPVAARFKKNLDALLESTNDNKRLVGVITVGSQLSKDMNWEELVDAGNTQLYYMPYVYLPDTILVREAFNRVMFEVAAQYDAIIIDGEWEVPSSDKYYVDSVHFTPAGSDAMSKRVASRLLASPEVTSMLREKGCSISPFQN